MSQPSTREFRILAVVGPEGGAIRTVECALRAGRDLQTEVESRVSVDVRIVARRDSPSGAETKRRVERLASEFGERPIRTDVTIRPLRGDDATNRTDALMSDIEDQSLTHLFVAADSELSVERLRDALGASNVELVPTDTSRERRPLLHPGGVRRLVTIFGITYLFYLAIGGFAGGPDFVTGAISAGVVALSLSRVALGREPTLHRTGRRLGRTAVFLPVLGWEIVKANVAIASIILHPNLPIDPSMDVFETETREGVERMALANSITLTPGTLTVDVREREFTIHSLTAGARSDLAEGRLQRLVAWVFHGSEESHSLDDGGESR